jgi:hydroxypyruvate reductase
MKNTRDNHLESMFRAAVERVDPYRMARERVRVSGDGLTIAGDGAPLTVDLREFDRVVVIGAGKASAPMARAVGEAFGERITESLVVVKYGHTDEARGPFSHVRIVEAAHPVPDEAGAAAARDMLRIAESCDERTLVLVLVSGGGSALLASPAAGLSLEDKKETTRLLLSCGADIKEINCVRKHLSSVKGGRLAAALAPARVVSLILSDVVGDRLDSIASGPCAPDLMSWADAKAAVDKYALYERLPASVRKALDAGIAGSVPDTPKPGDPVFDRVTNVLLGTNYSAMMAAEAEARRLGYRTLALSSMISGEAREIAKFYAGIALDQKKRNVLGQGPLVVMAGGETTVTIRGGGKGGRNQEMALAFLVELSRVDQADAEGIRFLASSTDGNDGPTDAAGAFASLELLEAARAKGLLMEAALADNDSYAFFDAIDGLLRSGPTNTNVCDIQFVLVE